MRVATWNVNSVRTRVGRVVDWLVREDVDVLGMQEIKCKPEQFPVRAVRGRRLPGRGPRPEPVERRRVRQPHADGGRHPRLPRPARLPQGPRGSRPAASRPAPSASPSTTSACGASTCPTAASSATRTTRTSSTGSRSWPTRATEWLEADPAKLALMGDWNVAPLDEDVWDMRVVRGSRPTSAQPERSAFRTLRGAAACRTSSGRSSPPGTRTGTTSSCGSPATRACASTSSWGPRRFADVVTGASIHRDERKGDAPSDHVPVVVDLDLETVVDDDRPMIF